MALHPHQNDVMACKACGATHAPTPGGYRQRNSFGLCMNCVADFYFANGNKRFTASDLNVLLANRLRKTLARHAEGKVIGRCEAITHSVSGGHQCAQHAQAMRKGRRVCTQHARSKAVNFNWDRPMTSAMVVVEMVCSLSDRDKSFKAALKEALE